MNQAKSYFDAMRDADEAVDDALAAIRAEEAEGRITPVQAATERVEVLERHLGECRRLRAELGGSPRPREARTWCEP
jgi:hypothetical protein